MFVFTSLDLVSPAKNCLFPISMHDINTTSQNNTSKAYFYTLLLFPALILQS